LRGIHFADVPPSQAKYVTCPKGAVLDVIVDIRVGSPTFGQWDSVLLDDVDRRAVYLSEGLGHAFLSLEDGSTVVYLVSEPYSPTREHEVNPLDPAIGIEWPTVARDGSPLVFDLSGKDKAAPTLAEASTSGLLPSYEAAKAFRAGLA
jgi:dTDP-4-dehydrorhamnose 3,5-epimerase